MVAKKSKEKELLNRLGLSDDTADFKAALADLHKLYFAKLYNYGQTRDSGMARAELTYLIHQAFGVLILKAKDGNLKVEKSLEAYLFGSVKHMILNFRRREERIKARNKVAMQLFEYGVSLSPEQIFIQKEEAKIIDKKLKKLGDKCQAIINLILEGKTYSEVSKILGYKKQSLKVIVHRCKKKVIELFKT